MLMEIENVWRFPALELVIATAILTALGTANPIVEQPELLRIYHYGVNLSWGTPIFFMFFIMPTLTARSIAKGLGGNEIRVLLSYPVKRWETFFVKVVIVFIPTFLIFAVAYLFNAFYMYQISPGNALPYGFMTSLLLPTLFITALSFGISFLTKDELKTVLLSLFTLLFLEFTSDRLATPFRYMSTSRTGTLINEYLISVSYGRLTSFLRDHTITDVQIALAFPILTSIILLAGSFVYFQFRLDID